MFTKCKVGDKLWSIQLGECEVERINESYIYVKMIKNINRVHCYTINHGRYNDNDEYSSLFLQKPFCFKSKIKKEGWIAISNETIVDAYNSRVTTRIYETESHLLDNSKLPKEFIIQKIIYEIEE